MTESPDLWLAIGGQVLRSTLVVLGLLALRSALSRWLAPKWLYALCLLGAVWLLLPVTPSSPYSLWRQLAPSPPEQMEWTIQTGSEVTSFTAPIHSQALPSNTPTGNSAPGQVSSDATSPTTSQATATPPLLIWILAIWLGGAALITGIWIWRELRFLQHMRQNAQPVSDPRLVALLEAAKAQMRIQRRVELLLWTSPMAPALAGVIRPAIVIRKGFADDLTDAQVHQVFMHELAHLKRHDLLTQAIFRLTVILHWFNPAAHWLVRAARRDRELATDALVLRHLEAADRHSYGSTLLHVARMTAGRHPKLLIGLLGMASPALKNLQTRIQMIDNPTHLTHTKWSLVLAVSGALLLTFCIGFQPAIAQNEAPQLPETDSPADLRIRAEIYEITTPRALGILQKFREGDLSEDGLSALFALTQGNEGTLIATPTVVCRSGQRARVQGGKTMRFLTEYMVRDNQETPKYTEALVGVEFELDPVIGPERKLIDINFNLAYSIEPSVTPTEFITPISKTATTLQIPAENKASMTSATTMTSGTSKLVGTAPSPRSPDKTIVFVLNADLNQ